MKSRSAKNKGRKLQNEVRDKLLKFFGDKLEADDVRVAIMGESGTDIKLSPTARNLFPYSIECKNQEKINIWGSLQQAEENSKLNTTPLLIFRKNRTKTYVALDFESFLNLVLQSLTALDNKKSID